MEKNEKRVRSGFTMAELLIVVAIIAVLTAIAIPVFSGQLEKSREATDLANLRSAYAEVAAAALANPNEDATAKVAAKKRDNAWKDTNAAIAGTSVSGKLTVKTAGGEYTVKYDHSNEKITIDDMQINTTLLTTS